MIADFRTRSSLHGQSILLDWYWKSAEPPADGFRLVRFIGRYEKTPEYGVDILSQPANPNLEKLLTEEMVDPSSGGNYLHFSIEDKNLEAGVYYYYTLSATGPENVPYSAQACALSTKQYGLSEQLYRLLPGILKLNDNPAGAGPLKRFLEIFGLTLDQARGYAESLSDRHNIFTAREDLLPHLADLMGWNLDQTLDVAGQRHELSVAPEVHQTLGTLPTLRAMINRATGWDCQIKEFSRNVFLSNAPEPNNVWELWNGILKRDGQVVIEKEQPIHTELREWFEGRPAAIKVNNVIWLFWSSDRHGRRQVYLQRFDLQLTPIGLVEQVTPFEPVVGSPDWVVDEDPAVAWDENNHTFWLFWSSNRSGNWDIWARTIDLTQNPLPKPGFEFTRITYQQAEDRRPAVVVFNDSLWLFWQSNRLGLTNIWSQKLVNGVWSKPERMTAGVNRDESPSAIVYKRNMWLAWQSQVDSGTIIRCHRYYNNKWWELDVDLGSKRCESPALLYHDDTILLFYNALTNNRCDIHVYQWTASALTRVMPGQNAIQKITSHSEADKEPAVLTLDDEHILLYWRSQERGKYFRSHTIDPNDETDREALAQRKTFADRLHYTYDPGIDNKNWYSFNTVGIYLRPENRDNPDEILVLRDQDRNYIQSIIQEFLPAHVRVLLFLLEAVSEKIYGEGNEITEEYDTILTTCLNEIYLGLTSKFYDKTPDWQWLYSWYAGLSADQIDAIIGRSNQKNRRAVHTNFKIPPIGG